MSAWGSSWGVAWGVSWGSTTPVVPPPSFTGGSGGGGLGSIRGERGSGLFAKRGQFLEERRAEREAAAEDDELAHVLAVLLLLE